MNGQEPPSKRKKPATEASSNLPLPDDLVMSCLSRVSRLHYLTLSLVSKNFQSLLASTELYRTRSLLGCTEKCLYVCLKFPPDPKPRWFTLYRKPDHTLTNHATKKGKTKKEKENLSGNVLASIRILNAPTVEWSSLVAVGPNLYAISGPIEGALSSSFSFLDCRTHTWVESPSLRIFDGEMEGSIYLPGCYEDPDSLNCIEVFNTKTQTWKPVPPGKQILQLQNMEGKIYMDSYGMSGKRGVAFDIKEMTVESVGLYKDSDRVSVCIIQNITYSYKSSGEFLWYDCLSSGYAEKLEGLEGLPKFAGNSNVKLVDYGGKLLVLWDKYVIARGRYKKKKIWCAVIKLERRNNGKEIWGNVEWVDAVLTVPKSYEFVYAIAATL